MNQRLTQLLTFLEETPEDTFTLYSIAHEYKIQGDYVEALEYFNKLQALDPDYVGCYYHMGKSLEALGEVEDAIDIYKKGIVIAEKNNDGHAADELKRALENLLYEEDL